MNERDKFLNALQDNEDDIAVRMAFADWLDDTGEHEEADRHRKWSASKAWIILFCEDHVQGFEDVGDPDFITYPSIMEMALAAAVEGESIFCGSNMDLCYSDQWQNFWKHWSVVTGIYMSPENLSKIGYRCGC